MTALEVIKGILIDQEPGAGYFGGAEGAVRVLLLTVLLLTIGLLCLFI